MVTVTLTEGMANAIGAGLDERSEKLSRDLAVRLADPPSQSRDFAVDVLREAIRDTINARLAIAAAYEEPEYADDVVFAVLDVPELELRALHGDR